MLYAGKPCGYRQHVPFPSWRAWIPPPAFNNSLTFPDLNIISNPWQDWNAAVAQANQVINIISAVSDAERTDTQSGALGLAYMAKGMALGHLANTFDQAFVVPLDADLLTLDPATVLRPYDQVITESIKALDQAIAIFGSGITYSTPGTTFNGETYTAAELAAYANTFAAHYIVSIVSPHMGSVGLHKCIESILFYFIDRVTCMV